MYLGHQLASTWISFPEAHSKTTWYTSKYSTLAIVSQPVDSVRAPIQDAVPKPVLCIVYGNKHWDKELPEPNLCGFVRAWISSLQSLSALLMTKRKIHLESSADASASHLLPAQRPAAATVLPEPCCQRWGHSCTISATITSGSLRTAQDCVSIYKVDSMQWLEV